MVEQNKAKIDSEEIEPAESVEHGLENNELDQITEQLESESLATADKGKQQVRESQRFLKQKIRDIAQKSTLATEKVAEIWQSLEVGDRAAVLGRKAKELGKDFAFRVAVLAAENLNSYNARNYRDEILIERFSEKLESDPVGAAQDFHAEIKHRKDKGMSHHTLTHNNLFNDRLRQKLTGLFEAKLESDLDEALELYGQVGLGEISYQAKERLGTWADQNQDREEELKEKLLEFPGLAYDLLYQRSYSGRNFYKPEDLVAIADSAIAKGDEHAIGYSLRRLGKDHMLDLSGKPEVRKRIFDYLAENNYLDTISDNFEYFREDFEGLPKHERQTLVGKMYDTRGSLLYNLRDVIALNEPQKRAIADSWLEQGLCYKILDKKNIEFFDINNRVVDAALAKSLEENLAGTLEIYVKQSGARLTEKQKTESLAQLKERNRFNTILKTNVIDALELNEPAVEQLFAEYIEDMKKSYGSSFTEDDPERYGQRRDFEISEGSAIPPEAMSLLNELKIGNSEYHPLLQKQLSKYTSDGSPYFAYQRLNIISGSVYEKEDYKNFYESKEFGKLVKEDPEKAKAVASKITRHPWLLKHEFKFDDFLVSDDTLDQINEGIQSFPKIRLWRNTLEPLLEKPQNTKRTGELITQFYDLSRDTHRQVLEYLLESGDSAQNSIKFLEALHAKVGRVPEKFTPYMRLVDKEPESLEAVLEIVDKSPMLFTSHEVYKTIANNETTDFNNVDYIKELRDLVNKVGTQIKFSFDDLDTAESEMNEYQKEEYFDFVIDKINPGYTGENHDFVDIARVAGVLGRLTKEQQQKAIFKLHSLSAPERASYRLIDSPVEELNEQNWKQVLAIYIAMEGDDRIYHSAEISESIKALFTEEQTENKEFCLQKIRGPWLSYLKNPEQGFPYDAALISDTVEENEGAGPLKYIESLSGVIHEMKEIVKSDKVPDRTKDEIVAGLKMLEDRFSQEKWSEEDRAAFYNLSKDVLKAAPSLFSKFTELFSELDPKSLKAFNRDNFPLYQAELVTLQNRDTWSEEIKYSAKELVAFRRMIESLLKDLQSAEKNGQKGVLFDHKSQSLDRIQNNFRDRFGLEKVPEEFGPEKIRGIQNIIRYIGNINNRDSDKENKLTFYLGLMLNEEWDDFRQGKPIDVNSYFSGDKLYSINEFVRNRQEKSSITAENLGIQPEQMEEFQAILQDETLSQVRGNVETIDLKLGTVIRSIEDLSDEDIYQEDQERELFKFMQEHGPIAGKVLAKLYQEASGKAGAFWTEDESIVKDGLEKIFKIESWDTSKVKEIQDSIKTPGLVTGIVRDIENKNVPDLIKELEQRLHPPDKIIEIFNRIGEDFEQESGAIALNQDLEYLHNVIVKNEKKLTPEEKTELLSYLDKIEEQMKVLEKTLEDIKQSFLKVSKSAHTQNNEILQDRLKEIERIINSDNTSTVINTRITNDMNLIIENMRQCLGCLKKEINNDTTLTFGDSNKFYLMSQGGKETGSVADQIVFFDQVEHENGEKEMSFVVDRLYGIRSADVLSSNVVAIHKKYKLLKQKFPDAKLSIMVTDAALTGIDRQSIINALEKSGGGAVDAVHEPKVNVNISASAAADHYVEFGGGTRTAGSREVAGLVIH